MAILDDAKVALRIAATNTSFDGEVTDLIAAAKADLALSGIVAAKVSDTDTLIKRAIITYCKAYFGYDNPDADRFIKAYDMLKTHLTLAKDYSEYGVTFTVKTSAGVVIPDAYISITNEEDVLITNSQGVAYYPIYAPPADVEYVVSCDGYVSSSAKTIYVDGQETEAVTLIET